MLYNDGRADRLRRKRRLRRVKFVQSVRAPQLALGFSDTSLLFIKVVKRLERKIDERLRSSTSRIAVNG